MLLQPAILSMLLCSALIGLVGLGVAGSGLTVLYGWDPASSDRRQLARERRALLVEAGARVVLGCQLLSLFLFVAIAQSLHGFFTGAMCAAGSLHAGACGYPTLLLKIAVFLLCGLWLIAHKATLRVSGIGLARLKYLSLLSLASLLVAENVLQFVYFSSLNPEIITACCAVIFGEGRGGLGADLAAIPATQSFFAFLAALALTLSLGARSLFLGRSTAAFSLLSLTLGGISLLFVISWVAPAYYELPNHHCPFCLLSSDYGHVGYGLYLALALALVTGCGSGLVRLLRRLDSKGDIDLSAERRLCATSLAGFIAFFLIAIWPLLGSELRMEVF